MNKNQNVMPETDGARYPLVRLFAELSGFPPADTGRVIELAERSGLCPGLLWAQEMPFTPTPIPGARLCVHRTEDRQLLRALAMLAVDRRAWTAREIVVRRLLELAS